MSVNAQIAIPKGKAQLIEFTNSTAKFTVPAGKTWYIVNLISNGAANIKPDVEFPKSNNYDEVRVYIRSIDNHILTDISQKIIGPLFYIGRGENTERITPMPFVLSENTTIEFVISTGSWRSNGAGELKKNDSIKAYINFIEVDN